MFVRIQRGSMAPLAGQIAGQIRDQFAAGHLRPGEPLPPALELARQLTVNFHAVCRAYDVLAAEGLLVLDAEGARMAVRATASSVRATSSTGRPANHELVSV
jgi:DNA-binding transcriptional regulator YhcF (GntR family)